MGPVPRMRMTAFAYRRTEGNTAPMLRSGRDFGWLLTLSVATALLVDGAHFRAEAQDADFKCRQTTNREYTKYVETMTKVVQRCNDAAVKAGNGAAAPGGDVA